jgi:POT family proton-dependent oligopeptide transporter
MLFAPLFSWLWIQLGKSGREPSAPYKFAAGLALLGLGFLGLTMGKAYAIAGLVPAFFLILLYLLHTLGELTLSPVGLSLVTKLSPAQIVGFLMGIWFLSSSIAHQAGKHIAKYTTVSESKIIESNEFKDGIADKELVKVLSTPEFAELLKKKPIEKALVTEDCINMLNANAEGKFSVVEMLIDEKKLQAEQAKSDKEKEKALDEGTKRILVYSADEAKYKSGVINMADAEANFEQSVSGAVISSLRNQSMSLGLGVFRILGFFAIGCGVLLFLLGPIIKRWMHGVN